MNGLIENTPPDVIVQHNPSEEVEYYHGLYGYRQAVLSDSTFGRLYGVSTALYAELEKANAFYFFEIHCR